MQNETIVGNSPALRKLLEIADDYATTAWPILILGETGVGKELLARRIHGRSLSQKGLFAGVNCGAIPATLFESELFGYERGAFTGALQSQRGLIRSAHDGTLFLDEIGEMDAAAQVKLLRWLDTGEVRPLGSSRYEKALPRLIAATHVDLARAVAAGTFRLDLLERLSVLTLRVPPLRERRADIRAIALCLLEKYRAHYTDEALEPLIDYSWPGNVRQLRNVVVRAVARGRGIVTRELISGLMQDEESLAAALSERADISESPLADIEKRVIIDRIRRCHGNKKRAAKELGIAKSTLHEKIRRWKLDEGSVPTRLVPVGS